MKYTVHLSALIVLSGLAAHTAFAGIPAPSPGPQMAATNARSLLQRIAGITEEQLKELEELKKKKLSGQITPDETERLEELKKIRSLDKGQTSDEDDC